MLITLPHPAQHPLDSPPTLNVRAKHTSMTHLCLLASQGLFRVEACPAELKSKVLERRSGSTLLLGHCHSPDWEKTGSLYLGCDHHIGKCRCFRKPITEAYRFRIFFCLRHHSQVHLYTFSCTRSCVFLVRFPSSSILP